MIDASVSSETLARAPGGGASSFPGGFPAGERRSRGGVACRAIAGDGFGSRSGDGDNVCDGDDVCVHFSNIEGSGYRAREDGQQVEFEVGPGRKGDEALNVRVI